MQQLKRLGIVIIFFISITFIPYGVGRLYIGNTTFSSLVCFLIGLFVTFGIISAFLVLREIVLTIYDYIKTGKL